MLSAPRRRLAVLAAVLVIGLLVAGCGGVRAQTQWSGGRMHGVNAEAGSIAIRDVVVVADDEGQQATVLATFANGEGEDELVRARVGSVEAEPEGGPLTIPSQGFARLGGDGTRLDIDGLGVTPGMQVEVELIFAGAPRATVSALVQRADGIYADALTRQASNL